MATAKRKARTVQEQYPEAFLLAFNIEAFSRRYGTTRDELAQVTMTSEDTFARRMKKPWEFTLCEITSIARLWGMTPAQLMVEPRYVVEPMEI